MKERKKGRSEGLVGMNMRIWIGKDTHEFCDKW